MTLATQGGDMAPFARRVTSVKRTAGMTTTLGISVRLSVDKRPLGVQYTCLLVGLPERFAQLAFQHFSGARQRERCVAEFDRAWALVAGDLRAAVCDHSLGGEVGTGVRHD